VLRNDNSVVTCGCFVVLPTPLAARVHRLTCGEQQGNPGQHSDDAASTLRKTKRSLEATDASGRPLAVVCLFDDLQQQSRWEVSPRTKHEVERLLRSDVSSRLVHSEPQKPVSAAIHGACFPLAHRDQKLTCRLSGSREASFTGEQALAQGVCDSGTPSHEKGSPPATDAVCCCFSGQDPSTRSPPPRSRPSEAKFNQHYRLTTEDRTNA